MAVPFVHTHVSFVTRKGRRRSQSVSIPNANEEDTQEQSIGRKQFLAQLRNERQKQQKKHDENEEDNEDRPHKVITRVVGASNTISTNKHTSVTAAISDDEQYQPTLTHGSFRATTTSMKKPVSSMRVITSESKEEVTSVSSATVHSDENEKQHGYQSQIIRKPQSVSKMSLNRQISNKTTQNSHVDSFTTSKGVHPDSSQISSQLYQSSTINLIPNSEIFDQDFHLGGGSGGNHVRPNDTKHVGKINISGREKFYTAYDRNVAAKSSAGFMAAIIAIIIGIIAFAFGLASLILILLLRSTIDIRLAALGANTTSTSTLSPTDMASLTLACSSYTTLNDPTRNVYATGYPLGCDNTAPFLNRTTSVWVRFIGTGGTTLPLTTPGMNICGSEGTGWYAGTMPSSNQLVNGTVCFSWYNNVCRYSQSISVANCGSYYTYLLPQAPACMMRYCTI